MIPSKWEKPSVRLLQCIGQVWKGDAKSYNIIFVIHHKRDKFRSNEPEILLGIAIHLFVGQCCKSIEVIECHIEHPEHLLSVREQLFFLLCLEHMQVVPLLDQSLGS